MNVWEAIQKISHEPMKIKRNFKIERLITFWAAIKESTILLSQYWKTTQIMIVQQKIFFAFWVHQYYFRRLYYQTLTNIVDV